MQFVEIANEEVTDLLGKGKGAIPLSAEQDEWEGSALQGAEHKIVNSAQQFADLYAIGVQNRTTLSNAFGRLSDKAAAVLSVEIIQITEVAGDTQVLVSKIMFVECPGLEVLAQDPESLKIKQGPTLNQGVLMLQDISYDLASGKADAINYGGSQLTKICSELLGGNAVSIAIFNYQYDDQIGSGATMKFMKVCQRIVNFPISNDNRAICLLHKLRKENVNLRKVLYGAGGETIEQYQLKIAELEKRLIGGNLETMKFVEEKKGMASKLQELKDKYNAVVKQKAEIQSQLLNAEEEKLSLSKGLIEQQIENAKLQEQIQNIRFEYEAKDIHAEADTLALESRQEKAQKTIMDLQESLAKITTEKREFELELMTVRRNYLNKCKEVEELKKKNQQVGVELINVINENKALMRGNGLASTKSGLSSNYDKFSRKITALENENDKLKEELAKTASELEKATSDKLKTEVILEQMKLDYDKKRVALEREYVSLAKNKDGQIQAIRKVDQEGTKWRQADKTLWESEKYDLHKKIKDLNRKLEMMSTELREVKELNDELKADKNSIGTQLDELRTAYRNKLAKATGDEARTELVNTYIAREKQMGEENIVLRTRIERLRTKCRSLREYAKQLKFLCEDVFPEDKMKPDILQVDEPPIIKEEQGDVGKAGKKGDMLMVELGKLKEENYNLKMTIEQLQSKIGRLKEGRGGAAGEGEIQKKILEELKMLKENPKAAGRPISGNDEYDRLRKERNNLLEENIKLKQIVFLCLVVKTCCRLSKTRWDPHQEEIQNNQSRKSFTQKTQFETWKKNGLNLRSGQRWLSNSSKHCKNTTIEQRKTIKRKSQSQRNVQVHNSNILLIITINFIVMDKTMWKCKIRDQNQAFIIEQ
eukprot:TRINITY_DN292_c0_g1_i1.p2 TRINITY_DN292_c0_g1~~TRINITY_DN292_c0_g1_i1.p2  ORF type:complete len:881 (+),score=151.65 TRINITY_DN292_c0_g1_i1:32227-34869(+)